VPIENYGCHTGHIDCHLGVIVVDMLCPPVGQC
jgi:hypothetical protein